MVQRPLGNHHDGPDTLLVTPDTKQTGPVAAETENLQEVIKRARFVLFDFDGPICRLFAGYSAEKVARQLVAWLEGQGLRGLLTEEEQIHPDPQVLLAAVNRRRPNSDLVTELEERLTQEELRAVPSAWPTAYADPLIRTWSAVGARLAIATNNSAQTAISYLEGRDLSGCFAPNVYGRTKKLHQLKPDPYCLVRALNAMGAAPNKALMIGDTPTDFYAAQGADVPFLGYARNAEREKELRSAGAAVVVRSLESVLETVRGGVNPQG
ncbi:HAD family hydrolase [Streptomyces sp. 2-1]|uniref:HAD family hydrolase n=1 Tax=Streptomyces sp. 2-1 TaxID=412710 RepID=UPI003AFAD874